MLWTTKSRIDTPSTPISASEVVDPDQYTSKKTPFRRYVTPFSDILAQEYRGSGTEEDPYIVEWLKEDHENPKTWADSYKWFLTLQVAIATLSVALASSAYSGAVESIYNDFHKKEIIITLGISLFVLGFAFGPLLWAPLSEILGRRSLYIFTYATFTLWQAVTPASQNMQTLIVLRFLAGFCGSSPLVNSGGTIADMFDAKERGMAMAIFASAPFLGPSLGPIIGGFLGENAGWRWVIGFLAIFAAVLTAIGYITMPETYAPVLLRWRAKKLSQVTGHHYICSLDKGRDLRLKTQFKTALGRPWLLLFYEPIVLILSIYIAIVYGILYSLFGAFPIVFQQRRGWSAGIGGLAFLGVAVGMVIAILYIIFYENGRYGKIADKFGGIAPPETRLGPAMIGAVSIVVGLAIFAATDSPGVPWIAPVIGGAPFGLGMVLIFLSCLNYLADSYLIYAASVLASNSVIRSLFGMAFPLFTPNMYSIGGKNGIHWGPAIGGLLALICLPFPFIFHKYGAHIRERCKYASEAKALLEQMMASSQQSQAKEEPQAGNQEADLEKANTSNVSSDDEDHHHKSGKETARTSFEHSTVAPTPAAGSLSGSESESHH